MNFVLYLLQRLKVEDLRETNEGYESRCPFHRGNRRNFRVSHGGAFCCQSGDCGESGYIIKLCKLALGIRYDKVLKLLKEHGFDEDRRVKLVYKPLSLDSITPYRRYPTQYLYDRGYKKEDIRLYDIVYNPVRELLLFPTFDMKGQLMALTTREPRSGRPYIQEGLTQKSHHIFGAYQGRKLGYDQILLHEGHCDPLGSRPVVPEMFPTAIGGSYLSEQQATIATRYFRRQILGFDNDEAGRLCTFRALRSLRKAGSTNLRILVYTASDPGDFPKQENLETALVTPREWLLYNKPYFNEYKKKLDAKQRWMTKPRK